jgi:Lrp/AsnC family leucine-responsive transcriptional regulator
MVIVADKASPTVDEIDRQLLARLQRDGREPVARLAEAVGLSPPPVHERLRRLEESGVIRGYTVQLDAAQLGYRFTAMVSVTLALHREGAMMKFRDAVLAVPEILDCYHTTGGADFLLRVVCRDTAHYEDLVLHTLTRLPGVERLNSSVVLSSFKATTALPLE